MAKRMSGIYSLYSATLARFVYVGSSLDLAQRKRQHNCNVGRRNKRLRQHIDTHGIGDLTFSVVALCPPAELADQEQQTIDEFDTHVSKGGYNVRIVADSNKGITGSPAWNKGQKMSPEYCRRTSESTRAAMADPAVRVKLSTAKKGKPGNRLGYKSGKPANNVKPISAINLTSGEVLHYPSIKVAADSLGFVHGSISAVCRGQFQSLKGYTFQYE